MQSVHFNLIRSKHGACPPTEGACTPLDLEPKGC